jgi:hypothetical protein
MSGSPENQMLRTFYLSRWLAREVLGKDVGRKPPQAERNGPPRNWKYRAWIRSLPCCACGTLQFVEASHTGKDGGMRQKSSDYSCVPLCSLCHRVGPQAYHWIGKDAFEKLHGLDLARLAKRLNRAWETMQQTA